MQSFGNLGLIILLANLGITWYTFQRQDLFERGVFQVREVLAGQWYRLLSAGFMHVSWTHLLVNMLTLYFFVGSVESRLGFGGLAILYLASLLGGNLLSLALQRRQPEYRAVGASGAVSGVVYAAIALFPGMKLAFILIPIPFPAWIYGVGFILYSIYGMNRGKDNIGHEAHLGGALTGLLVALALKPELWNQHPLTILYIMIPAILFLIVIAVRPRLVGLVKPSGQENYDIDDRYREKRAREREELDRILEKIKLRGRDSLTVEERDFLNRQ